MQLRQRSTASEPDPTSNPAPSSGAVAADPSRRLRSLVLAWHDEESGDDLTVHVRGSQQFLDGLEPLGFVPQPSAMPRGAAWTAGEAGDHRVRWIARLTRYWRGGRR